MTALRNFIMIVDNDEDGVLSHVEIAHGLNLHIFPPMQLVMPFQVGPITVDEVRIFDVNGDGTIDEHELGDMLMACFHHITIQHFPQPHQFGMNAFATLLNYVRAFNAFMDPDGQVVEAGQGLLPEPLLPPAPDYMDCPICLDRMSDAQQVMKCNDDTCNEWFHEDCVRDICNSERGTRKCPNCRTEWPPNCFHGFMRRPGPVLGRPQHGGGGYTRKGSRSIGRRSPRTNAEKATKIARFQPPSYL